MLTVKYKDDVQIWLHDVADVHAVQIIDEYLDRSKPTREINIGNLRITMFQADDVLGKEYEEFCDDLEAQKWGENTGTKPMNGNAVFVSSSTVSGSRLSQEIEAR